MKIGLLPLYIKLYDDIGVKRDYLEKFYAEVAQMFSKKGIEVISADFCRIKEEFEVAISDFERNGADAIVTLHMAYSPSLESLDALTKTKLPIIVMDSTPTLEFTPMQDPVCIDYNHGIHGVMDMCSMLKQKGKPYAIAAGHYTESDVVDRVCGFVRAAVSATSLGKMKVALVGGAFDGMGDFAVEPAELKDKFGICVEDITPQTLAKFRNAVTSEEIDNEISEDKRKYNFCEDVVEEEYREYTSVCLALRKLIDAQEYNAFSVNFLNVEELGTMPFVECCKAMERGIGYAGEGDALTAAFTGAFLKSYQETSFVEIFCPDWKNNNVFLSHMGEMNYRICDEKPFICRTGSVFVKGSMPYAGYSRMKGGSGVYVNISREKDDYQLLVTPCTMLDVKNDSFKRSMRGWMQPQTESTAEFLEKLSKNGATHHSSFIYGTSVEEIEFFGKLLGIKTVVI
ncbi:MAG: hypothetical protein IKV89_06005 [Clostridia bacterium]|nr:hypothetical protein [Clostridia bacterium]